VVDGFLREHLWPGLAVWVALYISDYVLTVVSARLYRERAAGALVFEGSYELTPFFERDIDALRWVSPRFLAALAWTALLLGLLWWIGRGAWNTPYLIALGALIFVEAAVHMRHVRNIHQFLTCFGPDGVRGRIEYPRPVTMRLSAFDLFQFAVLYLVIFLVTGSWLLFGGSLACLTQGMKQRRLAQTLQQRGNAAQSSAAASA
jgi:hypothetical protein